MGVGLALPMVALVGNSGRLTAYDLDFINGATAQSITNAGFTFARTGSAWGPDGTLFATGVPRIISGSGLLLEGASTNLCLRSQEFDNASWTKTASAITANSAVAPDGATTGDTYTESGSTGIVRTASAITIVAGTTYTVSVVLKQGNTTWCRVMVGDNTSFTNGCRVWVNLATGVLGTSSTAGSGATLVRAALTTIGTGWYRVAVTFSYAASTTLYVGVNTSSADNSSNRADVGGGAGIGSYLYVWQAQAEAGAFASSPIVTTSASVTRNADSCVATRTAGTLSTGTVAINATTPPGLPVENAGLYSAYIDSSTYLWAYRGSSGAIGVDSQAGGLSYATVAVNTNLGLAIRWSSNAYSASLNGGAVQTGTGPGVFTNESLGDLPPYGRPLFSYIRRVRRFTTALPNAQLITLSA